MITVNAVYFPAGYTDHDHLLPDGDDVFGDVIGRQFQSLGDIRRACASAAEAYGTYWQKCQTVSLTTRAEIVMANGDKRTVSV